MGKNDCNLDNSFCSVELWKSEIKKGKKRERRTHILKVHRGGTSQNIEKKIAEDTYKLKVIERDVLGMKKELGKDTHSLNESKGELLAHGKKGSTNSLSLPRNGKGWNWLEIERKQANNGHSHSGEGKGRHWLE